MMIKTATYNDTAYPNKTAGLHAKGNKNPKLILPLRTCLSEIRFLTLLQAGKLCTVF